MTIYFRWLCTLLLDTDLLKAISEHIVSIRDDNDSGVISSVFSDWSVVDGWVHKNSGLVAGQQWKPFALPIPPVVQRGDLILTLGLSR